MTAFIEIIPSEVFTGVLDALVDCSAEDNGGTEVNPFSRSKPVILELAGVEVSGSLPLKAQKQRFEIHAVDDPADGMFTLGDAATGDAFKWIDFNLLTVKVHGLTQTL